MPRRSGMFRQLSMRRNYREERSPTLPSKLDSPGYDLAGLLTYTSVELEHLPTGLARSGWNLSCSVLGAYSYGVVTDLHRLPEHQMYRNIESALI